MKVLLVWFWATVTPPGTVTFPLLLLSDTTVPPDAAGEVNVTVHVDVPGAFTVAGEAQVQLGMPGGRSERRAEVHGADCGPRRWVVKYAILRTRHIFMESKHVPGSLSRVP